MGTFAAHPAAYQTRAEREQEEAEAFAGRLCAVAASISDTASRISAAAEDGRWTIPDSMRARDVDAMKSTMLRLLGELEMMAGEIA
jgi:hypothetical protein